VPAAGTGAVDVGTGETGVVEGIVGLAGLADVAPSYELWTTALPPSLCGESSCPPHADANAPRRHAAIERPLMRHRDSEIVVWHTSASLPQCDGPKFTRGAWELQVMGLQQTPPKLRRVTVSHDLLRTFVTAARAGTFSRAAARRRVTKSAVSQQIRALEAQLGTALFERSGKGVRLTETGKALAEVLERELATIDEALDAVVSSLGGARWPARAQALHGNRGLRRRQSLRDARARRAGDRDRRPSRLLRGRVGSAGNAR